MGEAGCRGGPWCVGGAGCVRGPGCVGGPEGVGVWGEGLELHLKCELASNRYSRIQP